MKTHFFKIVSTLPSPFAECPCVWFRFLCPRCMNDRCCLLFSFPCSSTPAMSFSDLEFQQIAGGKEIDFFKKKASVSSELRNAW